MIHLRLITMGSGTTTVLGKNFAPFREGINGQQGFQNGEIELRLNEEGTFRLRFPNGPGDDGRLHRNRFKILTDADYRPGEEWFEVWDGDSPLGELLFVGTPTRYSIRNDTLELTGVDGLWTLRGVREGETGFWRHAPRDVFEHYSTAWIGWLSEGFDTLSISYVNDATERSTADNRFTYVRAGTTALPTNPGKPPAGSLRLSPGAQGAAGYFGAHSSKAFSVGRLSANAHLGWRVQVVFRRTKFTANTGTSVEVGLKSGVLSGPTVAAIVFQEETTIIQNVDTSRDIKLDTNQPGPFDVVIEGREDWIYFFVDGVLRGTLAANDGPYTALPYIRYGMNPNETDVRGTVDVQSFLVSRTQPYLRASGATGDAYDVPLSAASPRVGIMGQYYIDTDIKGLAAPAPYTLRFAPPAKSPYSKRIDLAPNFGEKGIFAPGADWQPSGPSGGLWFSARWLGGIELQTWGYDYRFRSWHDGRARLWVGKTRVGEELINDWGASERTFLNGPTAPSKWLTGQGGSPSHGLPGVGSTTNPPWYPIVYEYAQSTGVAGARLEFERDDMPGNWIVPGTGVYDMQVYVADGPVGFWKMNEGYENTDGTAYDHSGNGRNGTYSHTNNFDWQEGPVPGQIAANWKTASMFATVPYNAAFNPAGSFSVEAWVYITSTNATRRIVSSMDFTANKGWYLSVSSTEQVCMGIGSGTSFSAWCSAASSVVTNRWYHVVGTYDGTNVRVYLDGTLVAGPQALAYSANTTQALLVGAGRTTANAAANLFTGRAYGVAFYNYQLGAGAISSHTTAMRMDPSVWDGSRLSPVGVITDQIRGESHYEVIRSLGDTWDLQFTCEPKALESGEFPGRLVPKTRVGVDTAKVIDEIEADEYGVDGSVEEVADAILADAQGIADPAGGAQLTGRVVNFAAMEGRLFPKEEYESIADISTLELFKRRLDSILALRTNVWEEVSARPQGARELMDRFPLTNTYSKFKWGVGDGVRLSLPNVRIKDTLPRQIKGVAWPFVPAGVGRPAVSFRQRPRNLPDLLRRIFSTSVKQIRNYQGQIIVVNGSLGGRNSQLYPDTYTRANLPENIGDAFKATFVIQELPGGTWNLNINGTVRVTGIVDKGRIDVTAWLAKNPTDAPRMYGRLEETTATNSVVSYMLEILVRV